MDWEILKTFKTSTKTKPYCKSRQMKRKLKNTLKENNIDCNMMILEDSSSDENELNSSCINFQKPKRIKYSKNCKALKVSSKQYPNISKTLGIDNNSENVGYNYYSNNSQNIKNSFINKKREIEILEESIISQSSEELNDIEQNNCIHLNENTKNIENILHRTNNISITQQVKDYQFTKNNELDLLVGEIKKGIKQKKIRCRKNGFLEIFRKAVDRFETDLAFWQHGKRCGLQTLGTSAKIINISQSYGRRLIHLKIAGKEILIVNSGNKKCNNLLTGTDIFIQLSQRQYCLNNDVIYLGSNKIMIK